MTQKISNNIAKKIWLATFAIFLFLFTIISTAWLVRNAITGGQMLDEKQKEIIVKISRFPGMANTAIQNARGFLQGEPTSLLIERNLVQKPYWKNNFPSKDDNGYLLLSGLDPETRTSTIKLIEISSGKIVKKWVPDWSYIIANTTYSKYSGSGHSIGEMRAFHPLLLKNGNIIFNTGGALVRMGGCSSKPQWLLDEIAHHSVEVDKHDNVWIISTSNEGFKDNDTLRDEIREDAIAKVTLNGELIQRTSFAKILRENKLSWLLMGMNGFNIHRDPLHLNQITVAEDDSRFWKSGDLLISSRHMSTVFLYRPSSGKIIWSKSGPWMNQHSARFVNNHQISVFDNNVYSGAPKEQPFLIPGDVNRVMIYDFESNSISEPYSHLLKQERPVTLTEGRAEILSDGGLFIEETNQGRHLRFDKEKLLWSRINDYDKKNIGVVTWSRYLTELEASNALTAIHKEKCSP